MYYLKKDDDLIISSTLPKRNLDKYEILTKEEYEAYFENTTLEEDSNNVLSE
jgi:hypothetical protein